jgi:hypothetical protein
MSATECDVAKLCLVTKSIHVNQSTMHTAVLLQSSAFVIVFNLLNGLNLLPRIFRLLFVTPRDPTVYCHENAFLSINTELSITTKA